MPATIADEHDPLELVGSLVADKYRVEAVAGSGGFSTVYRANHEIWHQPVALKVFNLLENAKAEVREELLEGFVQEGRLMSQLSSRSAAIVQARDIGKLKLKDHTWLPYMVLEWLDGATLEDALLEERHEDLVARDLAESMALLEPVAVALDLAHSRGIAHRDLKPANLMLMGPARAPGVPMKILDFGIAKVMAEHTQLQEQLQHTTQQITAFTPNYGAPEQFSRDFGATGPWTDVYAMALIVLEIMRGGHRVLRGGTFYELGAASCHPTERPTPNALGLSVSAEVEAIFARAVAIKPSNRYPSMGAFWSALHAQKSPSSAAWGAHSAPQSLVTRADGTRGTSSSSGAPGVASTGGSSVQISTADAMPIAAETAETVASLSSAVEEPSRKRGAKAIVAALGALAVGGALAWMMLAQNGANPTSVNDVTTNLPAAADGPAADAPAADGPAADAPAADGPAADAPTAVAQPDPAPTALPTAAAPSAKAEASAGSGAAAPSETATAAASKRAPKARTWIRSRKPKPAATGTKKAGGDPFDPSNFGDRR